VSFINLIRGPTGLLCLHFCENRPVLTIQSINHESILDLNMKVKSEGKWKSIPMSRNFFSGDLEQAVCGGIEELTDYTLVVKGKKSGKALKRELSAKKNSLLDPEASNGELGHNEEPSTKKSKKNVFNVTDIGPPELPVMKDDENTKKKVKAKKRKRMKNPQLI